MNFTLNFDQEPLTKDEYINLSQKLIKRLFQIHQENLVGEVVEDGVECYFCYGYGMVSHQGIYDNCPSCGGSGYQMTKVLNKNNFVEQVLNLMFDSDENFIDLVSVETI